MGIYYVGGLVPDCSISSALAMEILHSYTKPSISSLVLYTRGVTIRRATIRYVSWYVGRDTTNDTISDDTPTNLESQTHFS